MRCCGISYNMSPGSSPGANDDFSVALYGDIGGTPTLLASADHEGSAHNSDASSNIYFDSAVELTAGTVYGAVIKSAGTNSIDFRYHQFSDNKFTACQVGTNYYAISRDGGAGYAATGGSAFTEDSDRIYNVWPIIDQIDDGAAGMSARARNALGVM